MKVIGPDFGEGARVKVRRVIVKRVPGDAESLDEVLLPADARKIPRVDWTSEGRDSVKVEDQKVLVYPKNEAAEESADAGATTPGSPRPNP